MVDPKLQYKNKIDSFVVTIDGSVDKLTEILHTFKKSPWWNIMTPYFVISRSKNGCSDAQTTLQTVWKMNILNCYFVCLDLEQKPFIYTFNPYSKYASDQWKFVEELKNGSHYMAIFNRPYKKENICEGFNFDRTKHLDKTTINIVCCVHDSKSHLINAVENKSQLFNFSNYDYYLIHSLKVALNVSLKFDYELAVYDADLEPRGIFKKLLDGSSDFAMCPRTHFTIHNLSASYPILYSGFSILSQNRGFRSPLEKMYDYYGVLMISATLIFSLMTYIVIWYVNKRRGHASAVFEILRLWTNNSVYTRIDSFVMRLFFSMIFLYFLILQATFQGHLAEFLTKPELRHNAESLSDLHDSFYTRIYTTDSGKSVIKGDDFVESKTEITDVYTCVNAVINDKSSVCIEDYSLLLIVLDIVESSRNIDKTKKIYHLSKKFLRNSLSVLAVRHDWPLKNRFDTFLMSLEHTGLAKRRTNIIFTRFEEMFLIVAPYFTWLPIDLDALMFIFHLLIMGIISGIFIFILERFKVETIIQVNENQREDRIIRKISKKRNKKTKNRKRKFNNRV
ncbi:uncharacterized protein LOC130668407 [Microplitis mediator]|uniref:uncharacterized protein LOC130668407 n=1 Tax=Microplitis mediator TaxID=375433 RepID=UPI00255674E0|nr:uncharacterized protein LOC130668407 [Microplitis mediator]